MRFQRSALALFIIAAVIGRSAALAQNPDIIGTVERAEELFATDSARALALWKEAIEEASVSEDVALKVKLSLRLAERAFEAGYTDSALNILSTAMAAVPDKQNLQARIRFQTLRILLKAIRKGQMQYQDQTIAQSLVVSRDLTATGDPDQVRRLERLIRWSPLRSQITAALCKSVNENAVQELLCGRRSAAAPAASLPLVSADMYPPPPPPDCLSRYEIQIWDVWIPEEQNWAWTVYYCGPVYPYCANDGKLQEVICSKDENGLANCMPDDTECPPGQTCLPDESSQWVWATPQPGRCQDATPVATPSLTATATPTATSTPPDTPIPTATSTVVPTASATPVTCTCEAAAGHRPDRPGSLHVKCGVQELTVSANSCDGAPGHPAEYECHCTGNANATTLLEAYTCGQSACAAGQVCVKPGFYCTDPPPTPTPTPYHKDCVLQTNSDPNPPINECRIVPGEGPDGCTNDDECNHTECRQLADSIAAECKLIPGKGERECGGYADCNHRICQQQYPVDPTSPEISFDKCVFSAGKGTDDCQEDRDCNHLTCHKFWNYINPISFEGGLYDRCALARGKGADECKEDPDCNHLACHKWWEFTNPIVGPEKEKEGPLANRCMTNPGKGSNECESDTDCPHVDSHKKCVGGDSQMSCVYVPGAGKDECSSGGDCEKKSHRICIKQTALDFSSSWSCVWALGAGDDECSGGRYGDIDCKKKSRSDSHKECFKPYPDELGGFLQCVDRPGKGADKCQKNDDCRASTKAGGKQQQAAGKFELPASVVVIQKDSLVGPSKAKVSLDLYHDPSCPFCRKTFAEVVPSLVKNYAAKGTVSIQFHEFAFGNKYGEQDMAAALVCAGQQKRYLQFALKLYERQAEPVKNLQAIAKSAGLKLARFNACRADPAIAKQVQDGTTAALKNGITGVPSWFIKGEQQSGAFDYKYLSKVIDKRLKTACKNGKCK